MKSGIDQISEKRWEEARSWDWQQSHPWLVGCNFAPSTAINQLEMWQPETFDPATIDRELGWLAGLGMNSVRVFLHDLLWSSQPADFLKRVERFLQIADGRGMSTLFVFFDSCWHPFPKTGPQSAPRPGVHNSFWLQSPGLAILRDAAAFAHLESYVTGVVSHFRDDPRIVGWDLWNEPDNGNAGKGDYAARDFGDKKGEVILPLLAQVFDWTRAAQPVQPLTSGVWSGDWSDPAKMDPLHRFQIEASDIVSFHNYGSLEDMKKAIASLRQYGRPLLCTEYMSRATGNTFEAILPLLKQEKVAAYNWGAVSGKTQTIYPWDSWEKTYSSEPPLWFHDILRPDGSPYDARETETIRGLALSNR
ncbi:MAG: cellulase family glycosylhydrolase [Methylacidiphilales bacterium]|nr:cellulase family glycosylhydrolase [Candidatus Methylacidiphilales bacterium]